MTTAGLARYEAVLAGLESRSRLRQLAPQQGSDFASNDYLGLARSERLQHAMVKALAEGVPVGSGGSRLLRGNHAQHLALEQEAAAFFGHDRTLLFTSGFAANQALFSCLPQRDDLVLHDALIHASVHAGMKAGKASTIAIAHNDVTGFDRAIGAWRKAGGKGRPWIAVESLYSMDGDEAPLHALAALALRHGGFLVVDEAHATGVLGPGGRGLAADLPLQDNILVLHTCGKALGLAGALLCLPGPMADFLINRASNFIFSTAPSPLMAAGLREALRMVADEPQRRQRLAQLVQFAQAQMQPRLETPIGRSHIMPVMIGDNRRCLHIAARLQAAGFDIRAIRPPTVPEGTARLRLSITLNITEQEIAAMAELLAAAVKEEI